MMMMMLKEETPGIVHFDEPILGGVSSTHSARLGVRRR
jgi:hypothetical protein